jgi:trehalose 6-phosphate phosphatase
VLPDSLDLRATAILLDVDGTILDIAPTPGEVVVPPSLRRSLIAIEQLTGGALALVSGRPLADLDRIFAPLRLPAIGGHGAELRPAATKSCVPCGAEPLAGPLAQTLKAIADRHPGVLVEDKGYSIALHYRLAGAAQGRGLARDVRHACEIMRAAGAVELLSGKAVIEIKHTGFTKGTAVRALMQHPPFRGRTPVFIGDDKTDEHAFAVMPEFYGRAVSVGRRVAGVEDRFESPAAVRRWLEKLSEDLVPAS